MKRIVTLFCIIMLVFSGCASAPKVDAIETDEFIAEEQSVAAHFWFEEEYPGKPITYRRSEADFYGTGDISSAEGLEKNRMVELVVRAKLTGEHQTEYSYKADWTIPRAPSGATRSTIEFTEVYLDKEEKGYQAGDKVTILEQYFLIDNHPAYPGELVIDCSGLYTPMKEGQEYILFQIGRAHV